MLICSASLFTSQQHSIHHIWSRSYDDKNTQNKRSFGNACKWCSLYECIDVILVPGVVYDCPLYVQGKPLYHLHAKQRGYMGLSLAYKGVANYNDVQANLIKYSTLVPLYRASLIFKWYIYLITWRTCIAVRFPRATNNLPVNIPHHYKYQQFPQ